MQLRKYQQESHDAVLAEWDGGQQRTLLVLPTGTGKTIVFCKIIKEIVRRGQRALILAHRGELLDQAADKMRIATGLGCAVEKASETCVGAWERIVIGSVQSMAKKKRLDRFDPDFFGAIVIDEAHHCLANGYQDVLNHFSGANVLGVTATPDRGDRKNLGQYFGSLAYEYSLPQAIKDGFLCKIKAMTIPLELDISSVKQQAGDYQVSALATALDPYLEQIADQFVEHCKERRTVVFLPLIATAKKFCHMLNVRGINACEVNGQSKDRTEKLTGFAAGEYDVLCNAMLVTEGWDCPPVDCIVVLRPTKIRSLYCQMVGRGTRIHPGKDHLLLLDFLWHTSRHELCRPSSLICESQDVADKMTANLAEQPGVVEDIEEAAETAASDAIAEREEALAKQLEEMRHKKRKLVDPLQFEMSIGAEDLASYEPAFGWEIGPPSEKQVAALEKAGINPTEITSAGKAAMLMDRMTKRSDAGLSTPKQIRLLERNGFRHVGQWEFVAASKMIARIAAAGWRVPAGVTANEYQPAEGSKADDTILSL